MPFTRALRPVSSLHRRVAGMLCGLSIALTLGPSSARAEEWTPTRSFRIFSKANHRGLPQSSVVALAQDNEGLLWIGTLDGLASFDGKTITPVKPVAAAPARGMITGIVARKIGGIAVGSPAGVHLFDGATWRLVPTGRAVASIAESPGGELFMADADGTLWLLDGTATWHRRTELSVPAIALAAAPDGAMWVATNDGAVRLKDGLAETVPGAPLPSRPGAMLVSRDGRAWVATAAGTVHWTLRGVDTGWHQADFASWPRGAFRCLTEDRRGRIWAGSYGGGLVFGNAQTPWKTWNAVNGPFEAGVMSVMADREGSVWFGLNAIGLAQWIGEAWSHRTTVDPTGPARQLFSGFGLSRGLAPHTMLAGVFQNGVLRLRDGGHDHYGREQGVSEDVRAVAEAEPGVLLAGTRFGIFESRPGKEFHRTLTLPGGFVMGLFKSPQGLWYAATSTNGVFVRDGGEWRADEKINAALDDPHVRGMAWLQSGELWVATLRGISIFHDPAPPERLTNKRQTELPASVNALLEVSADEVWAAGTGGIAVRRRGVWRRMTEADGVPGQTVYSLARGLDGAVWAGGSGGVGRYADGRFTVWDSRAGLLQEECNLNGLLVEDDGSVYVGTMGGMAHFDPSVLPLALPPLKLFWRTIPARGSDGIARVAASERALHLRWSAPWLDPRPVQFRTRVPRLHESWSEPMPDDHLSIENLGPGTWIVEVAARVEGTSAWTEPLRLEVSVARFWHETLLARAGLIALFLAVCGGIVWLRVRALRGHAANLEVTVRERTAQLAEKVELLQDSEQRALAASRAKSAFLANMSHELRTPLNGVLGFAQLLARRPGRDAEDRQGLSIIVKSGEHLLGLINDVLSLSKIEAGRVTMEESVFDLRAMVRDVEDLLRLRANAKDLHLSCELLESGMPRAVRGDERRLRQILINLLSNAVKFTERGFVTLRVSWHAGRAHFEVEDTGPGISADELTGLFEPFVQTEAGRRTKEGTGLGLALSRDLARLMGGDITLTSVPGKGSCFRVDVNLPEATGDTVAAQDRRRVLSLTPGQPSMRVLVVDDVALNRTVLSRLLHSVGFEVMEAADGDEALSIWHRWAPHLIWMDKRMPGTDGLEVTRRIRTAESGPSGGRDRVAIIALSASVLDHERGEILAAGCDDFVAKPFREATVFAKLREYLGVSYVYEGDPANAGQGPAASGPAAAAHAAPGPIARRVLLVDDDWICRQVGQELLQTHGLDVITASSGGEALALLESVSFDLVLMDLQMPEMSGIETARRIRALADTKNLPLIAMTAELFDGESARFAETGMDGYLAKPVEPEALADLLSRWLPPAGVERARA
ncbi:MAG: response regulator [Thermoanaerobaculia bacterium]